MSRAREVLLRVCLFVSALLWSFSGRSAVPPIVPISTQSPRVTSIPHGITNIVVLGDSQAICDRKLCNTGPSANNRWPSKLRTDWQANFGNHGTGLVPVLYGIPVDGLLAANPEFWTVAGPLESGGDLGPRQGRNFPGSGTAQLEQGSVATFQAGIRYDSLEVYCASEPDAGSLTLNVDGSSFGEVCGPSRKVTAVMRQVSLPLGPHHAYLICHGTCHLYAAAASSGSDGVAVHNLAIATCASACFGQNDAELAFLPLIPGGISQLIVALLTNDPGVGYTPQEYGANLERIAREARKAAFPYSLSSLLFVALAMISSRPMSRNCRMSLLATASQSQIFRTLGAAPSSPPAAIGPRIKFTLQTKGRCRSTPSLLPISFVPGESRIRQLIVRPRLRVSLL